MMRDEAGIGSVSSAGLIAVVGVILFAVAFGIIVAISVDESEESGLTGTFTYSVSGHSTDETEVYSGTWKLQFKDGVLTNSAKNQLTTVVLVDDDSISLEKYKISKHNSGGGKWAAPPIIDDPSQKNNSMINGIYYGITQINTNYGMMDLKEYLISYSGENYWCYCDDDGKIYLLKSEKNNVVYELVDF
ncbi:MAG: hypothetical protein LBJ20_01715 [Candidatus Methanoplasma sp.]|jgi:hypothetical protein|nr:hypothetical protein [Candidatus Methanoplasma sp.]